MTERGPSWRDLNAYADGELTAGEAATVARAVAEDPELAERVAMIARLKATVNDEAAAPLPDELGEMRRGARPPAGGAARVGGRTWAMLGATAAALAFVLILSAVLLPLGPASGDPTWRELAVRLHQTWAGSPPDAEPEPSAATLLANLSQLGQAAQVPDLSAARLTVGYLRPVSSDYGRGLHVGYRGTRGCRVSLIILPAAESLPEKPVALAGEDSQKFAWRVGRIGYALLASGMDPRHYAVVLKTVYDVSRTYAPVGPETRTALTRSRSRSRPCAA